MESATGITSWKVDLKQNSFFIAQLTCWTIIFFPIPWIQKFIDWLYSVALHLSLSMILNHFRTMSWPSHGIFDSNLTWATWVPWTFVLSLLLMTINWHTFSTCRDVPGIIVGMTKNEGKEGKFIISIVCRRRNPIISSFAPRGVQIVCPVSRSAFVATCHV